jgi:hypothetical protein
MKLFFPYPKRENPKGFETLGVSSFITAHIFQNNPSLLADCGIPGQKPRRRGKKRDNACFLRGCPDSAFDCWVGDQQQRKFTPFMAVYNKDHHLIQTFIQDTEADNIIDLLKE